MANVPTYLSRLHTFILQWHITERCNWHCKHCYREKDSVKELSLRKMCGIVLQYADLLKALNIPQRHGHLNIAGGEPFIRKDLFELLEFIHKHDKGRFRVDILTNGSFITKKNVYDLKSLGVRGIQLSLEGMREVNDSIRGKGSFDIILEKARLLTDAGMPTAISFTLSKVNATEILPVLRLCETLGIQNLGIRRFVPLGRGKESQLGILSPKEQEEIYYLKKKLRSDLIKRKIRLRISHGCEDGIFTDDICTPRCGVTDGRVLVLFPNGDVLACRRLPIVVGNILEKSLLEIYFSSDKLWQLRNLNNAHPLCRKCRDFKSCYGGALCITHAYFNRLSLPDPQCWRIFHRLPSKRFSSGRTKNSSQITTFCNLLPRNENSDGYLFQ